MAIHDATYQTPPRSFRDLRWRMLYLFEERVGKRISESRLTEEAREAAAVENLKRVLG
jgi:hypothetical protein